MSVCDYCAKRKTCKEICIALFKEEDARSDVEMDMQADYDESEDE